MGKISDRISISGGSSLKKSGCAMLVPSPYASPRSLLITCEASKSPQATIPKSSFYCWHRALKFCTGFIIFMVHTYPHPFHTHLIPIPPHHLKSYLCCKSFDIRHLPLYSTTLPKTIMLVYEARVSSRSNVALQTPRNASGFAYCWAATLGKSFTLTTCPAPLKLRPYYAIEV